MLYHAHPSYAYAYIYIQTEYHRGTYFDDKYFQDFVYVYSIHMYLQKVNFKLKCRYLFILKGLAQNILFKVYFDNAQKFCILENKSPYGNLYKWMVGHS